MSLLPSPEEIERRFQILPPIGVAWIKRLRGLGISVDALCEPELPAQTEVVMFDGGLFDFANETDGQPVEAALFLARDVLGYPADIVAWEPKGGLLASWYGRAALLGEEEVFGPRLDGERTLTVHETPRQWLLAERQGVVIINPRRAAPLLRDAEPLKTSSVEFGRYVARLINPKPPRIFAPRATARRAA